MVSRRGFLGILAAFLVAHKQPAPARWNYLWRDAFKAPEPNPVYTTYIVGKDAMIGTYADYLTVTTLAFNPVIKKELESVGYRISFKAAANILGVPKELVKDDG